MPTFQQELEMGPQLPVVPNFYQVPNARRSMYCLTLGPIMIKEGLSHAHLPTGTRNGSTAPRGVPNFYQVLNARRSYVLPHPATDSD